MGISVLTIIQALYYLIAGLLNQNIGQTEKALISSSTTLSKKHVFKGNIKIVPLRKSEEYLRFRGHLS